MSPSNNQTTQSKDPMFLSEEFLRLNAIKLVHLNEKFYEWKDNNYQFVKKGTIAKRIRKTAKLHRSATYTYLKDTRSTVIKDILESLEALCDIEDVTFDEFLGVKKVKDRYFTNFNNCITQVDIVGKYVVVKKLPHSQDFISNKKLSYDYKEKAGCPKFIKFLKSVLNPNEIVFYQEWLGYLLIPTTVAHKMLVIKGIGLNGKTIAMYSTKLLLGDFNVSSVPISGFLPGARFVLAKTDKKLINQIEEIDEQRQMVSAILKRYVAGNIMQVEDKFDDPVDMKPTARLMVSTNQELLFQDDSDGLKRRIIVLPFTKQIDRKDINVDLETPEYWQDELSGIRNFALKGLKRLVYNKWQFTETEVMKAANADFYKAINPEISFLKEYCQLSHNKFLYSAEIYKQYRNHCIFNGISPKRDSSFCKNIPKVFPSILKSDNGHPYEVNENLKIKSHIYYGITFKDQKMLTDEEISSQSAHMAQVY